MLELGSRPGVLETLGPSLPLVLSLPSPHPSPPCFLLAVSFHLLAVYLQRKARAFHSAKSHTFPLQVIKKY